MNTENKNLILCNGRIGIDGRCNKCFEYSQSTSAYCGRMIEQEQDVFDTGARLPEQKEFHPSFIHTQVTEVKIKEQEKEEDQDIKQIELLIWHGKRALCEEKCQCHSECNKADEFVEEFKSKFTITRKS